VQRAAALGLGDRRAVLGAAEHVARVADPVRPRHEHLAVEAVADLVDLEAVELLTLVHPPRPQRGADLGHDRALAVSFKEELRARRGDAHADRARTITLRASHRPAVSS
jgi:hypothetical protein